ncbi:hypothetical protein J2045_003362 [Peteryoungia aggregata LMG 23059]|uniref:Uncharacterized protein n=1 Tax=Peteryoungia aggregata LMG 23059 TaxID=1368425 RepID=A0ABU0GAC9_9HYPH|nr:hypothetical protein [Peteryoungia aggregata]MDQ0422314.1 hypothetical protein [Peteryoungia aggregata LMG 23059]
MPVEILPARLQVEGRPTVVRLEPMTKAPPAAPLRTLVLMVAILVLVLAAALAACAGYIIEWAERSAYSEQA